ncbi:MAG TPA: retropepsin-like aspartic protease [Rhizomicrobium sp.]|jgi:predicted aspartyl protease|nr:retropepsin-like aspartic protease [Rhizomicrobium sp.]
MPLSLFLAGFLAASAPDHGEHRLWQLYEKRDFFSLQRDLPAASSADSARLQVLRAQTASAFGRYEESNRILRAVLQTNLSDAPLERAARERLMLNERALFHYRAALAAILPAMHSASLRNRAKLLVVLQDVPPEVLRVSAGSVILHLDHFGAVQVSSNRTLLNLGVDTGANLSVLSRSAARRAGLHIRPAGYRIRLANGKTVYADVAAARLRFGPTVELSSVVFLVLPDSALRVAGRQVLDGLIGLPQLSQLGDIQFKTDGTVVLNAAHSGSIEEPIALIEGDPVVQVMFRTRRILCRIDTGSNRTVLYGKFPKQMFTALGIAERTIQLRHPVSLLRANQPYVNCSLGRDALRQLEPYTLNLHTMKLGVN